MYLKIDTFLLYEFNKIIYIISSFFLKNVLEYVVFIGGIYEK